MPPDTYQRPNHNADSFARTNPQTIAQRAALIAELLPNVRTIGEICCGDCLAQAQQYQAMFPGVRYVGVDIDEVVVAHNRQRGIECVCGDALDPDVLRPFAAFDLLFFGPPLSRDCDGHRSLPFGHIRPRYADFTALLFDTLGFRGTLVCIGPKQTTLGDVQALCAALRRRSDAVGLRLLYRSYATLTGRGVITARRLKYVDIWLSTRLADAWEQRDST